MMNHEKMELTAKKIIHTIEDFAPKNLAIEGDNIGLQVGNDLNKSVERVGIALDPSLKVIKEAYNKNVDFLFTHHPILKDPINSFNGLIYEKLKILIEGDIILYSAHTNLDICKNGLNDALTKLYNLKDVDYLYSNGLGRIGIFNGTFEDILHLTKKYLSETPKVINSEIVGDKKAFKVAVLSGYGLSQRDIARVSKLTDVYISGDLTHHSEILAEDLNLCVVDAGHYGTEVYGLKEFMKYLNEVFNNDIEIISLDF